MSGRRTGWAPSRAFILLTSTLVLGALGWYAGVMYLAPGLVARAFLRAQAARDNQRAFRLTSAQFRRENPGPEQMDQYGLLYLGRLPAPASLEPGAVRRQADTAMARYTLHQQAGAAAQEHELYLVREGMKWRVDFLP